MASGAPHKPIYSASWHRIAELRPRLRAGVRVTRQRFRGRLWYLFHDPTSTSHYRMSRPAYAFAGLLDGRRSVQEAWQVAHEQLGDEAPTQDEAITVLGQMHTSNLLHSEMPGDAELLLRRRTRARHREMRGYLLNILFARFRIADPDALLTALRPLLGPLFSVSGLIGWLVLVTLGVVVASVHGDRLGSAWMTLFSPENLVLLYAASVLGKLLHETAHGVACKQMQYREGATESSSGVHAVGVMLLVLVPFPYIDASSAWTLRSRARRAVVGAAGMMSDLALASVAMVVWARTSGDSLLNALALNVAFVSSISSLVFNANPLMRFDGYYILTDLIGQPNLYQRSRETLMRLLRRWLYGVRDEPVQTISRSETVGLTMYAVAAAVYRVFITVAIISMIATQWFALALPLAAVAVFAFMVWPVLKLIGFLANSSQLCRVRARAVGVTTAITLAVLGIGGGVPVPDRVRATGIVEPMSATEVYTRSPGFVSEMVPPMSEVAPGEPVLTLENAELSAQIMATEARLRSLELNRKRAAGDDPAAEIAFAEQVSALRARLDDLRMRESALQVEPMTRGVWMPTNAELRKGVYVERAALLGRVIDPERLRIRVPITQRESGVADESHEIVEIRVRGIADRVLRASRSHVMRTEEGASAPFQVLVVLDVGSALRVGQRVEVRMSASSKPILTQVARAVRQTLQRIDSDEVGARR